MLTLWLIVAVVAGLAAWFGAARMAARSWPAMGAGLALLLVGGLLCWAIGESKSGGGFLAGIIGVLCALLLFIAAGGVVLGAALRRLYEWRRPPPRPPSGAPGWWSVLGIGLLCGLGVLASVME